MTFPFPITSSEMVILFSFGIFVCSLFRLLSGPAQTVRNIIFDEETFTRNRERYEQVEQKECLIKEEEDRIYEHLRSSAHQQDLDALPSGSLRSDISQVSKKVDTAAQDSRRALASLNNNRLRTARIAIILELFLMVTALLCAVILSSVTQTT